MIAVEGRSMGNFDQTDMCIVFIHNRLKCL